MIMGACMGFQGKIGWGILGKRARLGLDKCDGQRPSPGTFASAKLQCSGPEAVTGRLCAGRAVVRWWGSPLVQTALDQRPGQAPQECRSTAGDARDGRPAPAPSTPARGRLATPRRGRGCPGRRCHVRDPVDQCRVEQHLPDPRGLAVPALSTGFRGQRGQRRRTRMHGARLERALPLGRHRRPEEPVGRIPGGEQTTAPIPPAAPPVRRIRRP